MARRILTRRLERWVDPARVFAAVYANEPCAFWLDGGRDASEGTSYLGAGRRLFPGDSLAEVVEALRAHRRDLGDVAGLEVTGSGVTGPDVTGPDAPGPDASVPDASLSFRLGWVGWQGYESGAEAHGVPVAASALPVAAWLFVERAIAFDHATCEVTLLALAESAVGSDAESEDAAGWFAQTIETLRGLAPVGSPPEPRPFPSAGTPERAHESAVTEHATEPAEERGTAGRWRHSPREYLALIDRCQEAIRRGDAYQLCLTNEIVADIRPDPLSAYLALRASSPSHHGGYLRTPEAALLSASPETFLRVDPSGVAQTRPIKGTRPRGATAREDRALAAELLASDKERAENLMIVDLVRNDLSKVAVLGTVQVTRLLAVESYSAVHQLVSTVEARLRPELDAFDAVLALFPAGSMTGAPKISAMRILHGLEAGPRGAYAGIFGYISLDGALDLAMIIRSVVLSSRGASIGTGGGITALSVAAEEVEETRIKAAPLLAALGIQVPLV